MITLGDHRRSLNDDSLSYTFLLSYSEDYYSTLTDTEGRTNRRDWEKEWSWLPSVYEVHLTESLPVRRSSTETGCRSFLDSGWLLVSSLEPSIKKRHQLETLLTSRLTVKMTLSNFLGISLLYIDSTRVKGPGIFATLLFTINKFDGTNPIKQCVVVIYWLWYV